jgi:ABC-type dipeptide/oligopeptide/nickel transport system permease component
MDMNQRWRSLARTLGSMTLTLLGVSVVVFVLMRVVPGDPVAMMIPPGATEQDVLNLRAHYGLDRSIPEQYLKWVVDTAQGDLGTSISRKQAVTILIAAHLPATLELAFTALMLALVMGGLAGVGSAARHGQHSATVVDTVTAFVQSIPDFLWGLLMILVFGVWWFWLPISGRVDPLLEFQSHFGFLFFESLLSGHWRVTASVFWHSLAPAIALALPLAALIARVLSASMQEALASDFVRLARLKGASDTRVLLRHALPNAITPTLQLTGVQFAFMLGGTVLIERLFSYPGIGGLAIEAVIARDLPLIQGIVLTFAVLFMLINLIVERLTVWLNPRLWKETA